MRPVCGVKPVETAAGDGSACLHDESIIALGAERVCHPLIIYRADQGVEFGAAHRDQHCAPGLRGCCRHVWLVMRLCGLVEWKFPDQAVLATLRFSTVLVRGHCISCQLSGTMGSPAQGGRGSCMSIKIHAHPSACTCQHGHYTT